MQHTQGLVDPDAADLFVLLVNLEILYVMSDIHGSSKW